MFKLRFDMRAPSEGPANIGDLYEAAIDMSVWGEQHGAVSVAVSEHHASPDGYLPSPLLLAHRVLTPEETVAYVRAFGTLALHPLCGGCPPEPAWKTLNLVADRVLPAVR